MIEFIKIIDKKDKMDIYLNISQIQYIYPHGNGKSHIKLVGERDLDSLLDFDLNEEETSSLLKKINTK